MPSGAKVKNAQFLLKIQTKKATITKTFFIILLFLNFYFKLFFQIFKEREHDDEELFFSKDDEEETVRFRSEVLKIRS